MTGLVDSPAPLRNGTCQLQGFTSMRNGPADPAPTAQPAQNTYTPLLPPRLPPNPPGASPDCIVCTVVSLDGGGVPLLLLGVAPTLPGRPWRPPPGTAGLPAGRRLDVRRPGARARGVIRPAPGGARLNGPGSRRSARRRSRGERPLLPRPRGSRQPLRRSPPIPRHSAWTPSTDRRGRRSAAS